MTQGERREKLVEEVTKVIAFGTTNDARMDDEIAVEVINLIAERLADVTEEMVEAYERNYDNSIGEAENVCVSDWRAMLAASPLAAGKDSP